MTLDDSIEKWMKVGILTLLIITGIITIIRQLVGWFPLPPVLSVVLLLAMFVTFGPVFLMMFIAASLQPEDIFAPPQDPRICPSCMAAYESPDSTFCWNCGMDFRVSSEVEDVKREPLETQIGVEARQFEESGLSISIGKCIVCKFAVKDNEERAWCPRCGAIAHRDHFLEWLHVKHTCPVCKERLNEELMRRLMS